MVEGYFAPLGDRELTIRLKLVIARSAATKQSRRVSRVVGARLLRCARNDDAAGRKETRMATIGFIGLGNMGGADGGQPAQGAAPRQRL